MRVKLKANIKCTKKNLVFTSGTMVEIRFDVKQENKIVTNYCRIYDGDKSISTSTYRLKQLFGNKLKEPSIKTMEGWMEKGVARSVFGSKVEPDGWSDDGSPSWMLVLGFI